MRVLTFALVAATLLSAAPSLAQCNCSSTGLFFDAGAETNCLEAAAGTTVTLHFLYAFPVIAEVTGFAAGVTVEGEGVQWTGADHPFAAETGALDLADLRIESATPLPLQDFTALLALYFTVTESLTAPVRFYLHSAASTKAAYDRPRLLLPGDSYYEPPIWEIEPESGLAALLAPPGEGCSALPIDARTWDGVKSLYR